MGLRCMARYTKCKGGGTAPPGRTMSAIPRGCSHVRAYFFVLMGTGFVSHGAELPDPWTGGTNTLEAQGWVNMLLQWLLAHQLARQLSSEVLTVVGYEVIASNCIRGLMQWSVGDLSLWISQSEILTHLF